MKSSRNAFCRISSRCQHVLSITRPTYDEKSKNDRKAVIYLVGQWRCALPKVPFI